MKRNIFTLIILVFAVVALVLTAAPFVMAEESVSGITASGTVGSANILNWVLYEDGQLVISGNGVMETQNYFDYPWYNYKEQILGITISEGITSIGMNAIYEYENLQSVSIPATVNTIEDYAIEGCVSLSEIKVSEKSSYFVVVDGALLSADKSTLYCYAIGRTNESFTFPNEVQQVNSNAFRNCTSLKSVVLNDLVWRIDYGAFSGCTSLKEITLTKNVSAVYGSSFEGCTSLESIKVDKENTVYCDIDGVLFEYDGKTLLLYPCARTSAEYTVPETVETIADSAFIYCSNLKKVTLSEGVTEIGYSAFSGCDAITEVVLPQSLLRIQAQAFSGCTKLTNVKLPANLTTLNNSAFKNCSSIAEITLPSSLKSFGTGVFNGCTSLKKVSIPEQITFIPNATFSGCSSLSEVVLSENVSKVDSLAFRNCSSLVKAYFYSETTVISSSAFNGCAALTIVGYTNSSAETFANTYNFKFERLRKRIDYGTFGSADSPLSWTYYDDNELVIEGFGAMSGWKDSKSVPWSKYSSEITSVVIDEGVTNIISYSFNNFVKVQKIHIPATVIEIQSNAFAGSVSLKSFDLASESKSFAVVGGVLFNYDKTTLICYPSGKVESSYYVPETVTNIFGYAFSGSKNLTAITISANVEIIGSFAFSSCNSLTDISVDDKNVIFSELDGVLFSDGGTVLVYYPLGKTITSYQVPNGVTNIAADAFNGCNNLSIISLPDSLINISDRAFYNNRALEQINIPDTVSYIGKYAFYNCNSLKTVNIPAKITAILTSTFRFCSSLEEIVIPSSVTEISNYAFFNCSNLRKITVISADTQLAFNSLTGCSADLVIVAPAGSIAESFAYENGFAFERLKVKVDSGTIDALSWTLYDNNELVIEGKAVIPDFEKASSAPWTKYSDMITILDINDGVTGIGANSFSGCAMLKEVYIPASVTSVSSKAFAGCSNLAYFKVVAANMSYVSDSGVLLTSDKTTLVAYPAGMADFEYQIPASVTTISSYAFSGCKHLKNVVIHENVSNIGDLSFSECTSLVNVTVVGADMDFGSDVFKNCNEDLVLSAKAHSTAIKHAKDNGIDCLVIIDMGTFGYETSPMYWTLYEDGLLEIEGCSDIYFDGKETPAEAPWAKYADQIFKVALGDKVIGIGINAFTGLTNIEDFNIPSGVMWVEGSAFNGCDNLIAFSVDALNAHLVAENGVLFNIYKDLLICYPAAKADSSYTIPESVINISKYAFNNCDSLSEATLPKSINYIPNGAFHNCVNLKKIVIYSQTVILEEGAFDNVSDAFKIYGYPNPVADFAIKSGFEFVPLQVKFRSASLSLYNDLAINFKVAESSVLVPGYYDPYVVCKVNGVVTKIIDFNTEFANDDIVYTFTFRHIAPDRLGETVVATLYGYYNDEVYELGKIEYSVAKYCYNMLSKDSASDNLKTLLVDLLNYGAAAQMYSGRNSNDLVNAALSDEQRAFGTSDMRALSSVTSSKPQGADASWKSASLALKHNIAVEFKFVINSEIDINNLTAVITVNGKETRISGEKIPYIGDRYVVSFGSFSVAQLSDEITAVLVDSDDNIVSNIITYSVESYAASKQNDPDGLGDLVKAMMKYGDSAKRYISKN